jgi:chloramphenicol-sensitive protein RarD
MEKSTRQGVMLAISAYGLWAIAPVYFKWIDNIDPFEILSHRVIWSLLLTMIILFFRNDVIKLFTTLLNSKTRRLLLISTLLIGANWGIFIWAINSDQMLSASLGYYINPLVNILLGMVFFAEKLDRAKKIAALLCLVAVGFEIIQFGSIPWIALVLATSFGLYGLVRKKLNVDSFIGMAMETLLLLPLAIGYLWYYATVRPESFQHELPTYFQLFLAGPVTMIPLLCFAAAANRISLSSLGFFQYIGPTGMFLLAVFVYGEALPPSKLITFGIIWTALAILVWDNLKHASVFNRMRTLP